MHLGNQATSTTHTPFPPNHWLKRKENITNGKSNEAHRDAFPKGL
jgi:hypothetical protein